MSEPSRRRVAIPTESDISQERRGCFRIAAILGVVIGLPLGILGVPAALNFFFDESTVLLGKTHDDQQVVLRIESVEVDASAPLIAIALEVGVKEGAEEPNWSFELEMGDGERLPLRGIDRLMGGEHLILRLRFIPVPGQTLEPRVLHLEEPDVRFELYESEGH